ncbi:MAG: hypothetical protein JO154_05510 [Chitinophaga sp.]|uniref:hypothetical protein n=1 Tax=Chitinophaga sp. TaxID=1869181 RepID=UPI0025BDC115|nr:hypothetical protein [Chitinophaga sp.]MBV8252045.1 hypothetical protein [Chitinophaga sp.]
MEHNNDHTTSHYPDYYDDVNEDIIGRPPRKILLWANLVIGAIFLCCFIASIFIKSPYKINSIINRIVSENGSFVADSWVSPHDLKKIKVGQKIQINLDHYPAEEYGCIEGRVAARLGGGKNNLYLVRIALTNGLVTDKGLKIDTSYQLQGHGEIIVYEKSLLKTLIGKNLHL